MILWLVGEPGIGKTTLARLLLALHGPFHTLTLPTKWTVAPREGMIAAGHYTGGQFDGADTVSYSGVKASLEHWLHDDRRHGLTMFDGDRFSYAGVVEFFQTKAPEQKLFCAHLTGEPWTAGVRRAVRGSNQNETWLKGRATKVKNFVAKFPGRLITMNAELAPIVLARELKSLLENR